MQYIKYLEKILITKGEAGVPGLGSFALKDVPSYISDGKMIPPAKKLVFEANLVEPGDELVKEFALGEKFSETEARESIVNQVNSMLHVLREGRSIDVQGIGQLKLEDGQILFISKISEVLNSGSFGLPEVEPILELDADDKKPFEEKQERKIHSAPIQETKTIEPIMNEEKKNTEPVVPQKPITPPYIPPVASIKKPVEKRNNSKWVLVASILVGLGVLSYFAYNFDLLNKAKSYFANFNKKEIVAPAQVPDSLGIDTLNEKRNALLFDENESKKLLTYYIISGSFKQKENAEKYSTKMSQDGFTTYTLNYGDTLFRVAIFASQKRQEAVDAFIEMQNEKGLRIWLISL